MYLAYKPVFLRLRTILCWRWNGLKHTLDVISTQVADHSWCAYKYLFLLCDFLTVIMAALCNRTDHYIFALWFLSSSSFYLFSSPNLSGHRLDVYHRAYFYKWRDPSANLECRSEMYCTRLAANTGRKKVAKNRHLGTIAQICRAISSQRRHVSTIGKRTC